MSGCGNRGSDSGNGSVDRGIVEINTWKGN